MRLPLITVLICTALAALAAACGGDDDSATNTPGSGASTAANGGDATATDTPATKTPAASGGGEDLNEYFRNLATRFDLSRHVSDAATGALNNDLKGATTLDEQKQAIKDFLDAMIVVFDDSIIMMNALDPPTAAEAPHFTFRDDTVAARAISETLKDNIDAADKADEAQAVIDDFNARVIPLVDQAEAACRDLQNIADQQNIDEDLACKAA